MSREYHLEKARDLREKAVYYRNRGDQIMDARIRLIGGDNFETRYQEAHRCYSIADMLEAEAYQEDTCAAG